MQRPSLRQNNEHRAIKFIRNYTCHSAGSVLASFGNTKVICTATIEKGVPKFLQDSGSGWLTAEYSMLPSATASRNRREVSRGKPSGRTCEIQRLIGRSLRAALDLTCIPNHTITIDCDVIQADGGTRTTAISGATVALIDAINTLLEKKIITTTPLRQHIAATSVGVYQGTPVLDLDYQEDSQCNTDMNIVMTEDNQFIEIQGTAENNPFSNQQLTEMLALAQEGIQKIIEIQKACLKK
jgi:ribonuclease PH